jgi:hypothetical protein
VDSPEPQSKPSKIRKFSQFSRATACKLRKVRFLPQPEEKKPDSRKKARETRVVRKCLPNGRLRIFSSLKILRRLKRFSLILRDYLFSTGCVQQAANSRRSLAGRSSYP